MGAKIKGIYKGFKYISQIFVVKEREMEIGHPTDVKHVAHIGLDGPYGTRPSWMNEFKTAPDFSIGGVTERRDSNPIPITTSRSTGDFEEVARRQPTPNFYQGIQSTGVAHVPKKQKRKKTKPTSSPKSSSRQSRAARSKAMNCEREATQKLLKSSMHVQDNEVA